MKNTLKGKEINLLFENGKWLYGKYLKIIYLQNNTGKSLVSAPIKKFKRAVDRNKIKRYLRNLLKKYTPHNNNLAIIYNNDEIIDYNLLEEDFVKMIKRINI